MRGQPKAEDLQVTPPAQLLGEMVFKLLPGDLDLEVPQPRDLDGLGEGRIGLEQGGDFEVCFALLGLLDVLRLGPEVNHRLHPIGLLEPLAVRGGRIVWLAGWVYSAKEFGCKEWMGRGCEDIPGRAER